MRGIIQNEYTKISSHVDLIDYFNESKQPKGDIPLNLSSKIMENISLQISYA